MQMQWRDVEGSLYKHLFVDDGNGWRDRGTGAAAFAILQGLLAQGYTLKVTRF